MKIIYLYFAIANNKYSLKNKKRIECRKVEKKEEKKYINIIISSKTVKEVVV